MPGPIVLSVADLIAEVKAELGEQSNNYITQEEVIRWLNFGLMDFCTRTHFLTSSATSISVALQKVYVLPADYMRMQKAFFDGRELEPMNEHELLAEVRGRRASLDTPGTPREYYLRGGVENTICLWLYPVPAISGKTIEVWYQVQPDAMAEEKDDFPYPDEWAHAIILFAVEKGHRKQRQLADADACHQQYMNLVVECRYRGQVLHVDKPQAASQPGLWAHKTRRWWA